MHWTYDELDRQPTYRIAELLEYLELEGEIDGG
jgi:hypothetical protein